VNLSGLCGFDEPLHLVFWRWDSNPQPLIVSCISHRLDQRFSTDGSRPGNGSWQISNGSWANVFLLWIDQFNHISLKRFLIAGRGNFYLKNTGRRAIWVEKHWTRPQLTGRVTNRSQFSENRMLYSIGSQPFSIRGTCWKFLIAWRNLNIPYTTIFSTSGNPERNWRNLWVPRNPGWKTLGIWQFCFQYIHWKLFLRLFKKVPSINVNHC